MNPYPTPGHLGYRRISAFVVVGSASLKYGHAGAPGGSPHIFMSSSDDKAVVLRRGVLGVFEEIVYKLRAKVFEISAISRWRLKRAIQPDRMSSHACAAELDPASIRPFTISKGAIR